MTQPVAGRRYDAGLHFLDRQLVDSHGRLVGKVDDLELEADASGALIVSAVLVGPGALGPRLGGRIGDWIEAIWRRLSRDSASVPRRISFTEVVAIDSAIHVGSSVPKSEGEVWVERYVVGRIPGAGHDPA
jgi:hypothetical protein